MHGWLIVIVTITQKPLESSTSGCDRPPLVSLPTSTHARSTACSSPPASSRAAPTPKRPSIHTTNRFIKSGGKGHRPQVCRRVLRALAIDNRLDETVGTIGGDEGGVVVWETKRRHVDGKVVFVGQRQADLRRMLQKNTAGRAMHRMLQKHTAGRG